MTAPKPPKVIWLPEVDGRLGRPSIKKPIGVESLYYGGNFHDIATWHRYELTPPKSKKKARRK